MGPMWVSIWVAYMGPTPKVQPGRSWDPYGQPRYIYMGPIWVLYGLSLIDLKFELIFFLIIISPFLLVSGAKVASFHSPSYPHLFYFFIILPTMCCPQGKMKFLMLGDI